MTAIKILLSIIFGVAACYNLYLGCKNPDATDSFGQILMAFFGYFFAFAPWF